LVIVAPLAARSSRAKRIRSLDQPRPRYSSRIVVSRVASRPSRRRACASPGRIPQLVETPVGIVRDLDVTVVCWARFPTGHGCLSSRLHGSTPLLSRYTHAFVSGDVQGSGVCLHATGFRLCPGCPGAAAGTRDCAAARAGSEPPAGRPRPGTCRRRVRSPPPRQLTVDEPAIRRR
jgi:hypothetical protein